MTILVRYDAACRALAEAKSVDEAKDVRDKAEAMRAYARQAKNKQLETDAAEIRIRAERRLGQLIQAQKETVGLADGGDAMRARFQPGTEVRSTLSDAGIDKKLSSRAQKYAAIPDDEFEQELSDWRETVADEYARVTTRLMNRGENARAQADISNQTAVVPDGQFSCIVIDPPWPMEKIERDVRPNQVGFDYPPMSEPELVSFGDVLRKVSADDCHLFQWTTHKFLPVALRLLEPWGFRYVLTMVWHKTGGFQPIGLPQYNCEFVIYARRGSPKFIDTKAFNCCFNGARREHSRKPDEFYDVVRRVTDDPRIDIFSRETRDGFAQFGNETSKFSEVA